MASLKFICPECGHPFAAGGGAAVACPKCRTEFADDAPAGGPTDAAEWSYRTSWQRFAVLGVLVVVTGVLGYALYEKRAKQADEARETAEAEAAEGRPNSPTELLTKPGNPMVIATRSWSDGAPRPDLRRQLVGTWESTTGDETTTIDYRDDGTFTYTYTRTAGAAVTGTWKVDGAVTTWAAEGHTIPAAPLSVRGGKIEKHPLLHRPADAAAFERK